MPEQYQPDLNFFAAKSPDSQQESFGSILVDIEEALKHLKSIQAEMATMTDYAFGTQPCNTSPVEPSGEDAQPCSIYERLFRVRADIAKLETAFGKDLRRFQNGL